MKRADLELPGHRRDIEQAVASLANQDPSLHIWRRCAADLDAYVIIDTLVDGPTEVADHPAEYLGVLFRNEDELRAWIELCAFLLPLVKAHAPIRSYADAENAFLTDSRFADVVGAAVRLQAILKAPDC